jgi:hypothetical protein
MRSTMEFGPTLAVEKLAERPCIPLSAETLRIWGLDSGMATSGGGRGRIGVASAQSARGELLQMAPTMTG